MMMSKLSALYFGVIVVSLDCVSLRILAFIRFGRVLTFLSRTQLSACNLKRWCPGPDLNRHAPVKEAQDFKTYSLKSYISGIILENQIQFASWCHSGVTRFRLAAHPCAVITFLNSKKTTSKIIITDFIRGVHHG